MSTTQLYSDDLVDPISADQPAGVDLRWTPEWDRIEEARRADDTLNPGQWAKKERKTADWQLTQELAMVLLRDRSKDLQLAMWLTEANIMLRGFAGLRDGLRITRELMIRYWDSGLFPRMEDGQPENRAGPFEWLNGKLVGSITTIPITAQADKESRYNFIDLQDALRVGTEARCRTPGGEVDSTKKKKYDQALADGHISMEMFERAVRETGRAAYEELNSNVVQAHQEFEALEEVIDAKFGKAAPNLSAFRTALREIKKSVSDNLDKVPLAEPETSSMTLGSAATRNGTGEEDSPIIPASAVDPGSSPSRLADSPVVPLPLSQPNLQESQYSMGASWREAEMLVRSGDVESGLAEMMRLAAKETSGRDRFQRKLLLADVCLASKRERLARSILEELADQIDKSQLELWESSEFIASVWTRLYRLYKQGKDSSDTDRANQLYKRLCKFDPWQALGCWEG